MERKIARESQEKKVWLICQVLSKASERLFRNLFLATFILVLENLLVLLNKHGLELCPRR